MAMLAVDPAKAADPVLGLWRTFMGNVDHWTTMDMIETLRSASILTSAVKPVGAPLKSISNEAAAVRDALKEDPYNMMNICKLGFMYAAEFRYPMATNVMMRGWKRADELKDSRLRRAFLTKLSEVSYREGKAKQAHAILQDIYEEPEDRNELKNLQILTVHVCAASGKVEEALKALGRAVEGEDIELVIRIWALVSQVLAKNDLFEAAKVIMNNIVDALPEQQKYMGINSMQVVSDYAAALQARKEEDFKTRMERKLGDPDFMVKVILGVGVGLGFLFLTGTLYWLEQKSLASMTYKSSS